MTEGLANFQLPETASSIIKVIGVGGGGCNAVNHMFEEGITGVDYIICNTDSQALDNSPVSIKIQLGVTLTEGRGAGNKPEKGAESARESYEELKTVLGDNTKMLFITAGMGGGTGTGAAPVVASLARELNILTIAVVTIPSPAEGQKRRKQAQEGIEKMAQYVDSMLVISNDRLHHIYGDLPASQAFKMADSIVATAVKGVAEIITVHGNVNIDYTDVETVMQKSEVFIMGTGFATGEGRAMDAVHAALESPLLDSNDIFGTKNILLNIISGSEEIRIGEIGEIIEALQQKAGEEADIIWGNGYDDRLGDKISVTILATGFDTNPNKELQPEKKVKSYDLDDDIQQKTEPEADIDNELLQDESLQPEESIDNGDAFIIPEPEVEETVMFEPPKTEPQKKEKSRSFWGSNKEKKKEKPAPKIKEEVPVKESSGIDNWFYEKFGKNFFNDGDEEDQPLE